MKLNFVYVKFAENREICFKLAPSAGRLGRVIFDDHQQCAIIESAGTDYFATFETDLGKVTYIFCSQGSGFKIGPGTSQIAFEWQ